MAAEKGNQNSLSDAGVAALTARTCAEGAYYNVLINLDGLEASDFTRETRKRADAAFDAAIASADELSAKVRGKLCHALDKA